MLRIEKLSLESTASRIIAQRMMAYTHVSTAADRTQARYKQYSPSLCCVGLLLGCILGAGCERSQPLPPSTSPSLSPRVVAQGQILPDGGFIQLAAAPGDLVEEVLVDEGDVVEKDAKLITLRSETVRNQQVSALAVRRENALQEQSRAIQQAKRAVAGAELKLSRVQAQQAALDGQEELLVMAREQIDASKAILQKLLGIAQGQATSEFVGQLEIDQQRIKVRESEMEYKQQEKAQQRARQDLQWAEKAAKQELEAAHELLVAAEESTAVQVVDAEINTLKAQADSTLILAPSTATVLSINASRGEAAMQLPLIELADLESLVCEIEINEMDAARVEEGDKVEIHSRAFGEKPLTGHIREKTRLVGRPKLKPIDPLARVDYRAVTAIAKLDAESVERAADWLQLQVEVDIHVGN